MVPEQLEQLGDARVAGGPRDRLVEGEVFLDGAAASTSIARRSSITSSTSPMELSPSGSMRKGTRLESPATNAPDPCRVVTSPSARSAATASRTTVRLTPMAVISACSVGRRAPGANLPLRICPARRSTTSSVRLRARSGRDRPRVSEAGRGAGPATCLVIVQILEAASRSCKDIDAGASSMR
jgi:hypothetical protein